MALAGPAGDRRVSKGRHSALKSPVQPPPPPPPTQVAEIEAAEKGKMREKCEKIIGHGINCFINRQLIYNYPEEIFAEAGAGGGGVGGRGEAGVGAGQGCTLRSPAAWLQTGKQVAGGLGRHCAAGVLAACPRATREASRVGPAPQAVPAELRAPAPASPLQPTPQPSPPKRHHVDRARRL
jgi:hypothetical protein